MSSAAANAKRAFELGAKAAREGKPISDNPFVTRRVMGLSNWWEKGWRETSQSYNEEIKEIEDDTY